MTGLWVLVAAPVLTLLDAATSHRARALWTGVPDRIRNRIDAWDTKTASALGGEDE